jgi:predicted nuclease of restriction endonuclease-like (RecB) superfamily
MKNSEFEKKIIDKVVSEYGAGFSFVSNKRTRIDDRYELYNNITDQDKKIYDRLIKTIVKVQKALH